MVWELASEPRRGQEARALTPLFSSLLMQAQKCERNEGMNEMNEIDLTGNPAHVLAAIAKARGEPIDDALVQHLAALCSEEVQAPRFLVFVDALAQLCKMHGVRLSTSGYDGLEVWDADDKGCPIHCAGIEDRMKQNGQ